MANCFVVMAIGDQKDANGDIIVSESTLRDKYKNLIKEAISNANPDLEVVRADDSGAQGMISTDILNRLMFSDFVVVDITHPNPNVFYELGLRHACKPKGTIILKDKDSPYVPFDISHLRYIEYTDSTAGLSDLKSKLKDTFAEYERSENISDNQFQDQAKLLGFQFPIYEKPSSPKATILKAFIENPALLEVFALQDPNAAAIFKALAQTPNSDKLLESIAEEFLSDDKK